MKWRVVARPQAEDDVREAAHWYDVQQPGLGGEFIDDILALFDALAEDPLASLSNIQPKISAGVTREGFLIASFMN